MIRVLIADDQELVRTGFRVILETEGDIEVVAEAENGHEAIRRAALVKPEVVLMDIRMPELDGLEATRRILATDTSARVLVLTTFDLDDYVFEALRAGASGFVLKDDPPEQLLAAVRTVASGEALLSPAATKGLIASFLAQSGHGADERPGAREERLAALTGREREVLVHVAGGLSNDEIAGRLQVSPLTVKTHVNRAMAKLQGA